MDTAKFLIEARSEPNGARMKRIPLDRMHLWLMLVLTFSTGLNDAVGYLGLDKVFTGNMTGNVVVLGMALGGGRTGLPILGPIIALFTFMGGGIFGGHALKHAETAWTRVSTALISLVSFILLTLGTVLFFVGNHPPHWLNVIATSCAAFAMGIQAAVALQIGVQGITTVVVTMTIVGLASDCMLGTGKAKWRGNGTARRLVTIGTLLLGAFTGAMLLKWHLGFGLLLAAFLTGSVAIIGGLHAKAQSSKM